MRDAVIIDALRSPIGRGKAGGQLADIHPVDLLAQMIRALVERNQIDPATVDDVIAGCVSQVGEQAANPARVAWLAAGYPESVPGTSIERRCGSGQQAIHFGAQGIMSGAYDIVIAGGVESMSRVPMGIARMDKNPFGPLMTERYNPGPVPQGISAEIVAGKWSLGREELDRYAARSHALAHAAANEMGESGEIVPVTIGDNKFSQDETIRPSTSVESLAQLKPSFVDPRYEERFSSLPWSITAGNSSQLADGAAVVLLMSSEMAKRLGMKPRARFVAFDVIGSDPIEMLTGPIASTRRILAKARLGVADIDHFEVNEAFASVPLAWQKEIDADPEKINPRGGAIAFGHPLGASGARLLTTMLYALEGKGGRLGLQTMCAAGGMATTMIIEAMRS
jgi:acetyl-CoA acetyltransferase family protein